MNDAGHDEYDDLEERLGRLRPADLPRDLLRRLRAAEPTWPPVRVNRPWRRTADFLAAWLPRPWPLAYAGLLAAWVLIAVLRLLTLPLDPPPADHAAAPLASIAPHDSPAFASTFAAERAFLLAHNNPEQP